MLVLKKSQCISYVVIFITKKRVVKQVACEKKLNRWNVKSIHMGYLSYSPATRKQISL